MAIGVWLKTVGGKLLHTEVIGEHTHLVTVDHARTNSQFKSTTFTGATTQTVVTPPKGQVIVMTDFLISAKKFSAGELKIQFTDGTDTVDIFVQDVTDLPVYLAFSPVGRWRGWKDARIDIVVVGDDTDPTVALGYYFLKGEGVLTFADWDAQRG